MGLRIQGGVCWWIHVMDRHIQSDIGGGGLRTLFFFFNIVLKKQIGYLYYFVIKI